ncbi:PD-(D/E)XK nuclease family transposase [uncultured Selenomonas sp.]|uniref:PD-(D/E)XK nuclease family transposase n=1 Tax=uncultured Selenomonas sp. TaxID=159275 RepID=UPI00280658F3|nr:PD-(D/E)XK nuclease family transposase [uncultured Selenomonas sp.]
MKGGRKIPKYQSKEIKKMSRVERWLAYFANQLDKEGKEELAMSSPAIKEAMTASECYVMNDKSYQEYLARESAILDYNNDVLGNCRLGREEGHAEGLAKGQKKGMDALAALNRVLLKEKRYDDLARASLDAAYRQKLLEDFGIE